ncbi:membrane-bound acylglycerophosphatidylinositol O-acyltransferase frj-like isoform X2 [Anticarsia gemmatalis]|uniref:membrane-bound acylglycerophosphatidylinositol O-acyltransferase frj-like isoform X2 n=1 Tax=Anticarsia gemmatalis TaxID=129554 RepID=UPI003F759ADA
MITAFLNNLLRLTMPIAIDVTDVVFYGSLVTCIVLGNYYKKIQDIELKKNYGTGLGILVTYLICGFQIYHSALMVWGNIIIMKCCDKRYVHQLSLAYTWTYLSYLSFNVKREGWPYDHWIHQTIALRLVGLAFEIYMVDKAKNETSKASPSKLTLGDPENMVEDPTALEIISYAYYFIGLHKGPYYRWKIYQDHFNTPFSVLGDFRVITEQKLKKVLACSVIYLLLRTKYPVQMYHNDVFYKSYGADNRYLYNLPQMMMYYLQYQVIMMLCTSVCTEAGFGVYPAKCQSLPGHGPSMKFSLLKLASSTNEVALEQEYNFGVLRTFENDKVIFGPMMRDTLRGWDMSVRYWFWAHTYKNMVRANNEVKSALSFLAWTIWCGPTIPQLIISSTLWVHIHLESEYSELYETTASMKTPWDIGFTIMRLSCLTYLTPCLILQDPSTILRYYNSILWVYHVFLLMLIVAAVALHKSRETPTSDK